MYGGYLTPEGPEHEVGRKADPPFPTKKNPVDLALTAEVDDRKVDPPFPTVVTPVRTETGLRLEISLPAEAIEHVKLEDGTLEIRLIPDPER